MNELDKEIMLELEVERKNDMIAHLKAELEKQRENNIILYNENLKLKERLASGF